ncbi:MAG: class I SAM-dependent methyltransferase [bacterium]
MAHHHPVFARLYSRLSPAMERSGMGEYRDQLLAGLTGRVVEVGAGDGANFPHYPAGVASVVAVEPEPYLRARARKRAAGLQVPISVVDGVAERLPIQDAGADAGVVSLALCSVTDPHAALQELHRVIRPGGELRFFEHVRAESAGMRQVQRALDATVWPLLAGGCHTGRDTAASIAEAGFVMEQLQPLRFPDIRLPTPVSDHIHGVARRP